MQSSHRYKCANGQSHTLAPTWGVTCRSVPDTGGTFLRSTHDLMIRQASNGDECSEKDVLGAKRSFRRRWVHVTCFILWWFAPTCKVVHSATYISRFEHEASTTSLPGPCKLLNCSEVLARQANRSRCTLEKCSSAEPDAVSSQLRCEMR